MAENLKTSIYNNGDSIAHVTDGWEWFGLTSGAWCNYNNNSQYDCPYGKLYNWYAVADPRNVCPSGWHVPSDDEWSTLTNFLGGTNPAWSKLKSTGTLYWFDSNGYTSNSTNESGFSALPGGFRSNSDYFQLGTLGTWWSSTEGDLYAALSRSIGNMSEYLNQDTSQKMQGSSIRCLRD
jgi:uncharacterized protein (TIGR02145 family)